MRLGMYLHWQDANDVVEAMLKSGQWDSAWIEADVFDGIKVFTLYGIVKHPNEALLIYNAYDAY